MFPQIDVSKLVIPIAALLVLVGLGWYLHHAGYETGKAEIQSAWNIEEAQEKEAQDEAAKLNDETNKIVQQQHAADVAATQSAAGRAAVDSYIATHGLLPSAACGSGQAVSTERIDATAQKLGTSASSQELREFTQRCAADALTVLEWQEWVVREGLDK